MSNTSRWDLLRDYFTSEERDPAEECRVYNMEDVQGCTDFRHMEPAFEKYCQGTSCPKCPFASSGSDDAGWELDDAIVKLMDELEEMARVQTKDSV